MTFHGNSLNKRRRPVKLPEGVESPVGMWERKGFCWGRGPSIGAQKRRKWWLQRLWFCWRGGGEKGAAKEASRSGSWGCVAREGSWGRAISEPRGLSETQALRLRGLDWNTHQLFVKNERARARDRDGFVQGEEGGLGRDVIRIQWGGRIVSRRNLS